MSAVARFFQLEQHGTTVSREVIAGLTTFTTMSYIVVVNPAILSNAGIPAGPCFVATVVAAVFIACALFVLLTVLRLRQWVVDAVPVSLRYSFAVGIGLFLTFIGLNQTGIVTLGVAGAPVRAGHLTTEIG